MPEIERNEILRLNLYEIGNLRKIAAAHWTEVKNSVGSTFNRGDFTALNAFFWASLDLSQYAKRDTGYTPFKIELVDGAGKKATGYLGAVGAGETLGAELITAQANRDFSGANSWTNGTFGTFDKVGDLSVTGNDGQFCYLLAGNYSALTSSALYKFSYDYTLTSGVFRLNLQNSGQGLFTFTAGSNSDYFVYGGGSNDYLQPIALRSPSQGDFDNLSWKRVTNPPSTAVHIVSSLNGTVRDWASIESGFDPNNIASWKIYHNDLLPV